MQWEVVYSNQRLASFRLSSDYILTPKTKHAFLRITGYYCKFIPNSATVAVPLTNLLTKKNALMKWSEQNSALRHGKT